MVRVSERAAALKAAVVWLALHLPASQDSFDIQVLIQPHRRVLGKNSSNKGISWYITEKKTQSIAWHSASQRVVVGSTPAVPPPNHSHHYQILHWALDCPCVSVATVDRGKIWGLWITRGESWGFSGHNFRFWPFNNFHIFSSKHPGMRADPF